MHSENGTGAARKIIRHKALTQKANQTRVHEHVKILGQAISEQVSKNRKIETRIANHFSCIDNDLLQEVKDSLTLIDIMYNELTTNKYYRPDVYTELKITMNKLHADRDYLMQKMERQLYFKTHDVHFESNKLSSIHKTDKSSRRLRQAAANANAKIIELQAKLEAEKRDEELEIQEQELAFKKRQVIQRKLMLKIEAERQKSKLLNNEAKKQEIENSLFLTPSKQQTSLKQHFFFDKTLLYDNTNLKPNQTEVPVAVARPAKQASEVSSPPENRLTSHLKTSAETTTSVTTTLVNTITESMNTTETPIAESMVFDGDPLKYNNRKHSFNAPIARKALCDEERPSYLPKYISPVVEDTMSVQTSFDWNIVGQVNKRNLKHNTQRTHFKFDNESSPCKIIHSLEQDSGNTEYTRQNTLSQSDNKLMIITHDGIKREDGIYTMLRPLKRRPDISNTKLIPQKRFRLLKPNSSKQPEIIQEYTAYINDTILCKGYHEAIPGEESNILLQETSCKHRVGLRPPRKRWQEV